jgi:hypothetical protein
MILRMVRSRSPGVDGQKVFDLPAWVPSRIIRALAADRGFGVIPRAGCVGLHSWGDERSRLRYRSDA